MGSGGDRSMMIARSEGGGGCGACLDDWAWAAKATQMPIPAPTMIDARMLWPR